ncbi:MAG: ADP-ribosylglycohydrolase family protein [Candidatus Coproplasma sp.]
MMFIEKCKAVVIGHAVGDALGVPVEFSNREMLDNNPVTDMRDFGTYAVPKGSWSDDTSMSIAALDAIGEYGLNFNRVMQNFGRWYYKSEFTPAGKMFDVGNTCSEAIENYFKLKLPLNQCGLNSEYSNGNGSLMRIHPFVLYLVNRSYSIEEKLKIIHIASALTHAHRRSKIGCGIYAVILWELLENPDKESIYVGLSKAKVYYKGEEQLRYYARLFNAGFKDVSRDLIKSGGYIVESLEAAVWCLLTTDSYREAVLKAVNLGYDTDTVGAICGGLAGALYGYEAIPQEWRDTLLKREYIEGLCDKAFNK